LLSYAGLRPARDDRWPLAPRADPGSVQEGAVHADPQGLHGLVAPQHGQGGQRPPAHENELFVLCASLWLCAFVVKAFAPGPAQWSTDFQHKDTKAQRTHKDGIFLPTHRDKNVPCLHEIAKS